MTTRTLTDLEQTQDFIRRHIGPDEAQTSAMLAEIGAESVDALIDEIVPNNIRLADLPAIEESKTEVKALADLKAVASQNIVNDTYIGLGYYGTHTPNVILRNVLENPGWYTAYTPYQPEIAQGRLESLLNYQQMCLDLTGLDLASASLLDEGTAAAEAMALAKRVSKNKKSNVFLLQTTCSHKLSTLLSNVLKCSVLMWLLLPLKQLLNTMYLVRFYNIQVHRVKLLILHH
jgi:glycine dehydrogenase